MGSLSTDIINSMLDHLHGTPYTPPVSLYLALSTVFSVVNATYRWTLSGNGSHEYYLENADGSDPKIADPGYVVENERIMTKGIAGTLTSGQWDYTDNDGIGGNRIYVRLLDDFDPDTHADGYVMVGANPETILVEPGDTYSRQTITFNSASARKISQSLEISYSLTSSGLGYVTHWAVMDSNSGGNKIAYGKFSNVFEVGASVEPKIHAGDIWIESGISTGGKGYTDYCVNGLLNLVFRGDSFSVSGLAMALLAEICSDSDETLGADINEISGTGYSKVDISAYGGASPAFTQASSGIVENANIISWGTPGADDWGQVTGIALVDTNNKILRYDNSIPDVTPNSNDSVEMPVGGYQAEMT